MYDQSEQTVEVFVEWSRRLQFKCGTEKIAEHSRHNV